MIPGVVERNGSHYRRFKVKRDGRWVDHYVRLPHPDDPTFAEELARVNGKKASRGDYAEGTIGALVKLYRAKLAKAKIADSTRRNKLYYADLIENEHGHRLVAQVRRSKIIIIRDKMQETPGKANNYLSVLKSMLEIAVDYDWIEHNPARGVALLELDEHDPWPKEVIAAALAEADPMLRLAIVSGLCCGQRVSDVIRIQHHWLKTGFLEISQLKTDVDVAVPVHAMWRAEISKVPRKAITILYDRSGKPFTGTDRIQERMRRLMRRLGYVRRDKKGALLDQHNNVVEDINKADTLYTYHGLRKNACCYLLQLGLSDTQVGSILGMTPETVRHYGKKANVLLIAQSAAEKVLSGKVIGL